MATTINGSAGVTTNSGAVYDGLQRATAETASGTTVDFTGIPSWAKRITVMFNGVSTNGTSIVIVQLGDAGGIEDTGYSAIADSTTQTTGVPLSATMAASDVLIGVMPFVLIDGNTWITSTTISRTGTTTRNVGSKTLSATLDRLRITTVNGTNTFDAGTINIMYE